MITQFGLEIPEFSDSRRIRTLLVLESASSALEVKTHAHNDSKCNLAYPSTSPLYQS
jgi:hypothetical protein